MADRMMQNSILSPWTGLNMAYHERNETEGQKAVGSFATQKRMSGQPGAVRMSYEDAGIETTGPTPEAYTRSIDENEPKPVGKNTMTEADKQALRAAMAANLAALQNSASPMGLMPDSVTLQESLELGTETSGSFKGWLLTQKDAIATARAERRAANAALKAKLTETEIMLGHAIRTGIALSALTVTVSTAYIIHPFTPMDIMNAGMTGVQAVQRTLHQGITNVRDAVDTYYAYHNAMNQVKLQETNLEQAKIESDARKQKAAELEAARAKEEAEKKAKNATTLYSRNANGELEELSLPSSLYYIKNDYDALLNTAMGPMLYLAQGDTHWADYLIGGQDRMARYGCGPTAIAMIANSFSDITQAVTPQEVAEWAMANKLYAIHGGSYHALIKDGLEHYGLQVDSVENRTAEEIQKLLNEEHILVALMGRGALTDDGHFVILCKNAPDGNVMIADPANFENSKKTWPVDQIVKELKKAYDAGGPLWAVSKKTNG